MKKERPAPRRRERGAWVLAVLLALVSGCGFYFKTYRYKGPAPFVPGMTEQEVLSQWGSPLSVQVMGPARVWRYFVEEPAYGKKKVYHLVWLQDGKVLKWQTVEEEALPPQPAAP